MYNSSYGTFSTIDGGIGTSSIKHIAKKIQNVCNVNVTYVFGIIMPLLNVVVIFQMS